MSQVHRASPTELSTDRLVVAADLCGTAVFAAEGAMMAIASHLDLLGILVAAFVTALGGGILRDILLGSLPPAALRDQRYTIAVFIAAAVAASLYTALPGISGPTLLMLDAAGLALFTVVGTQKALRAGLRPLIAAMIGCIAATGGGAIRDMLLNQVPGILRVDFYATAALAGAAILIICRGAGFPPRRAALVGGGACFVLRVFGAMFHWHLATLG
jgi:uncharacterized membrane protein YeiH